MSAHQDTAVEAVGRMSRIEAMQLFDAIAHGDEPHREWLKEALSNWADGAPVPAPRGKGADTTLREQRDELLEALEAADKALKYYEWYNNPASGWALPENEHVRGKVEAALTKVRGS